MAALPGAFLKLPILHSAPDNIGEHGLCAILSTIGKGDDEGRPRFATMVIIRDDTNVEWPYDPGIFL